MKFQNASVIEQLTWQMRLADYPRAQNRALINSLFDGAPPYTPEEESQNNIAVNVNFLESTKLAHDARQQFSNAVMKPGKFFTARTDMGTTHKRAERGTVVTNGVNRIMKRCNYYFESLRSKFAMLVLHGIAPSNWESSDYWCPRAIGVEDVMIPSGTLLTFQNLPFFALYRSYTAEELYRLTHGAKVDPGWQMKVVNAALKWADNQAGQLNNNVWPEYWSPDRMEQRMKEDSGLYASDAVPVISAWDFYFWNDEKGVQGWNRRIVLDAFGQPGIGGIAPVGGREAIAGTKGEFLYNPGTRKYATNIREIIGFQFADLSAVAPFRYHSVRSLGFLLYAVCHLQNRLRCKFNEAVFEGLQMYLRVKSLDDAERALKIDLISRGIVEESVQFLPPSERWQVDKQLAELGLMQNQQIINENSSSYVQNQNYSKPNVEKTAFQVRAELNATTALISAALLQAYQYQAFEYQEIFRRFCRKDSRDPEVREFRLYCLKRGVPENMLVPEAWDLEPERVMGSGNKTLELATAETLMQWRPLYAPQAQQEILRVATLAVTDDPGLTKSLVPNEAAPITDSRHDAMVAMGSLMLGLPVKFTDRSNRIEVTETLLAEMAMVIQRIEQNGGMAKPEEIVGLQTVSATIAEQIQLIAADKNEKERARKYADDLKQLDNMLKAYIQRLQQAMQKAQQNGAQNGEAAAEAQKEQVKLQGMALNAEAKAANARESHAQKTAQRQVQWENEQQRKQQTHAMDMERDRQKSRLELAAKQAQAAIDIEMSREKAKSASKSKASNEGGSSE